tara:strand:+ start:64 stop:708 length:645 start_codon:yes stop_codon:yes gene_type:complete
MINTLLTLANSPIGKGAMGLFFGNRGQRQMDQSFKPNTYEELAAPYQKSQALIDRQSNFGNYSSGAMDLAMMQGNQAANTAAMMGMGGSAANMLRNRMKASGINDAYRNFTAGLGDAARAQYGIDSNISNQMFSQNQNNRMYQGLKGEQNYNMGQGMLTDAMTSYGNMTDEERKKMFQPIGQLGNDIFGRGGLLQGVMGQGRDAFNNIRNIWGG